jgi:hypothetical protein
MVKVKVYSAPGRTLVPAGILIRAGPNLYASPLPSPTAPRRIMLASFQAIVPVFFMVTETVYLWPAFMVDGIVLAIYCADVDDEAADTTPGITIAIRRSPIIRLMARDLENSFDNLIGQ